VGDGFEFNSLDLFLRAFPSRAMKLKQSPDDFRVEEQTDIRPANDGAFAFYRLDKRGWTTPDALAALRRRWKIDLNRLSYGGLKDRHADTSQYLTIFNGPRKDLRHQSVSVTYLGQASHPYSSTDIRANTFTIAIRDLTAGERTAAQTALEEIARVGVPNYFDDQRFGSVSDGKSFVAREMILGRFEEALKLALAAPYAHDRAESKREKAILRECWGDWKICKERLPRGHARSIVDYLVSHPTDFRGAVARLRPELRGLYLSAYQSHLWNRMLARWLMTKLSGDQLVALRLRLGEVPAPRSMTEDQLVEWQRLTLPLPSARLRLDHDAPLARLVEEVMADEGFPLSEMKIRGMDKPFFSKGDRPAAIRPMDLEHRVEPDDRHAGREKLMLRFDLPRGAYATMIVKRLSSTKT
jgi:tRNA pseudouridine13 synthase